MHSAYVCEAIGGPKADTNYNLATVHVDMVNAGLDDEHFDAVFAIWHRPWKSWKCRLTRWQRFQKYSPTAAS